MQPILVRIDVTGPGFVAGGSGFFVDSRGYILTNQHVIDKETGVTVTTFDGTQYSATVVEADATADLALLKLTSTRTTFPSAPLGTSANLVLGQDAIVGGFPLGTDLPGPATFTSGIVSAIRNISGQDFIQMDTAINPGNSGGCVFDITGKVIGVVDAALLPTNLDAEELNLAIPIDSTKAFIQTGLGK